MIIDDVERIRLAILYILRIGPNHKSQELDGHHLNVQLICFGYLKHVYSFNTGGHLHRVNLKVTVCSMFKPVETGFILQEDVV